MRSSATNNQFNLKNVLLRNRVHEVSFPSQNPPYYDLVLVGGRASSETKPINQQVLLVDARRL